MPDNLFRQALGILNAKNGERTGEEQELLDTALIPLNIRGCPFPAEMTIGECLEELAKIVEEAQGGNTGGTR
ncbi:hypothetical protein ES705_38811 [subsurface metagenome]